MKLNTTATALALLASFATAALSPAALADSSTQKDKNNMRNLGIAGAAIAGYGLLNHNSAATILGAAAGGYGAYKYEQDRKSQSAAQRSRDRYYHHRYSNSNRYYHHRYSNSDRKYYSYGGHEYYMDRATGERHRVD